MSGKSGDLLVWIHCREDGVFLLEWPCASRQGCKVMKSYHKSEAENHNHNQNQDVGCGGERGGGEPSGMMSEVIRASAQQLKRGLELASQPNKQPTKRYTVPCQVLCMTEQHLFSLMRTKLLYEVIKYF